jgi:hypothetical protein
MKRIYACMHACMHVCVCVCVCVCIPYPKHQHTHPTEVMESNTKAVSSGPVCRVVNTPRLCSKSTQLCEGEARAVACAHLPDRNSRTSLIYICINIYLQISYVKASPRAPTFRTFASSLYSVGPRLILIMISQNLDFSRIFA